MTHEKHSQTVSNSPKTPQIRNSLAIQRQIQSELQNVTKKLARSVSHTRNNAKLHAILRNIKQLRDNIEHHVHTHDHKAFNAELDRYPHSYYKWLTNGPGLNEYERERAYENEQHKARIRQHALALQLAANKRNTGHFALNDSIARSHNTDWLSKGPGLEEYLLETVQSPSSISRVSSLNHVPQVPQILQVPHLSNRYQHRFSDEDERNLDLLQALENARKAKKATTKRTKHVKQPIKPRWR